MVHGPSRKLHALPCHFLKGLLDEPDRVLVSDGELRVVELLAPAPFKVGPHALDGVKFRGCWRHKKDFDAQTVCIIDSSIRLMGRVVVHDHDAAVPGDALIILEMF